MGNEPGDAITPAAFVFPDRIAHHQTSLSSRGFRLFVICVGQTRELPGFKHPAKEMPTPPSDYIPLRVALRRRRPAYFLQRAGNLGMKGNFDNRTQRITG
jgi:hypothetical protein